MPSTTEKQRRFMGAELERLREGRKTSTGMTERELEDFARKPTDDDKRGRRHEREARFGAATLPLRRLRFRGELL